MFTLTEALQAIADRSFYEDATVTPLGDGRYAVGDDFGTAYAGDSIMWSYDGGMELPANVADHSRLHEASEFYDAADHVAFNLPHAVELLEAGHAVTFAYTVVEAFCERTGDAADIDHNRCECLECDSGGTELVGWALLAFDRGPADN